MHASLDPSLTAQDDGGRKFIVKKQFLFFAVLFTLVILRFFFIDHGATKALYDFDEARYAEVAKNILATNSWWVQHASGPDDVKGLYLWKPPLHPIVIALSYKLFGVNELGVRFPTLLFFLGNCIIIFLLAKRLSSSERLFPYLATVLFAVFPDNAFLYSQGIAEQQLLFFNLLAFYSALQQKRSSSIIGGIFWGLALLTKGFAAWWVPTGIIIFNLKFLISNLKIDKKKMIQNFALFLFFGLIVALPWHIYMYSQFGKLFIDNYVLANTIGRSVGASANIAPFWWYGTWIIWSWRPFVFLLPLVFLSSRLSNSAWRELFKTNRFLGYARNDNFLLILWFLLILIPFSLIKSKVWWYIFPASIPLILFSAEEILVNPLLVLFSVVISMLPIWDMGAISTKLQMILYGIFFLFSLKFEIFNLKSILNLNLKKIIIFLVCASSLLFSLKMSIQNSDTNKDLKILFMRNKTSDLSTYKIPYEAALFYSNNGTIKRDDLSSRYVVTKKELANTIENNYWEIDEQGQWVLMKKIY